jgi:ribosomal subunit interface protein
MTTPNITFKHTSIDVDYELQSILTQKITTLEKYFEEPTLVEVEFRKEAPKNNGDVFVVEINCAVKGELYRAVAKSETFENSIDKARNELDKELRRARKKRGSMFLKGARRIKEMMRWGGR